MAYTVVIPQKVAGSISGIQKKHKDQIYAALKALEKSPLLGKKLWGQYRHYRSLRAGDYRIIYHVQASELVVLIVKIANRQGVY